MILELLGALVGLSMWAIGARQEFLQGPREAPPSQGELSKWGPPDHARRALQRLVGELTPGMVRGDHYPFALWHVGVFCGRTLKLRVGSRGTWQLAIHSPAAANEIRQEDQQEFADLTAELCSSPESRLEAQPEGCCVTLHLSEPFSEARLKELASALRRLVHLLEQGRNIGTPVPVEATLPLSSVEREAGLRCPYCHDDLGSELATGCGGCQTQHHVACYAEAGCTVLGCGGGPARLAA